MPVVGPGKPRLRPCRGHKKFRPDCVQVHIFNPNKLWVCQIKTESPRFSRSGRPTEGPGKPGGSGEKIWLTKTRRDPFECGLGPSSLGHTTRLTGKLAVPMGDTSFPLFGVVHKVVFKDAFYFVLVYPPPGGPDCHWVSGRFWPGSEGLWGRFWHGSEGNLIPRMQCCGGLGGRQPFSPGGMWGGSPPVV